MSDDRDADGAHDPWAEDPRDLPPGVRARRELSLRRINALAATLTVLLVLVVLPATLALGGLGMLGLCYDGCTDAQEAALFVGFALVPAAYVLFGVRWVRGLRRAVEADPAGTQVMSVGSLVLGAVAAVLLALMALVVTCFGLLGLL